MQLTDEQKDIRETGGDVVSRGGNLKVIAFAGAGKTTTLKTLAEGIQRRGCYLAFNKSIADEARRKFARTRCTAYTMHALAFGAVRDIIDAPASLTPKDFRESGILSKVFFPTLRGWTEFRISAAVCRTLSTFCNSDDETIGVHHAEEAMISASGDPDLMRNEKKAEEVRNALRQLAGPIADMASMYWRDVLSEGRFSHDVYLKLLDLDADLRRDAFGAFRYLMVDEAQDLNPVQRSILEKTGLPLIAVGDPYQQIYSWRGAENALAKIEGEVRFLTQSFRFREDIAGIARQILESRPDGGPEQRLIGAGSGSLSGYKGPRIAVICRSNIGMIDEALKCAEKGLPAHVDNIQGLLADVLSAEALYCNEPHKVTSTDLRQFDSWEELKAEAEEAGGSLQRLVQIVTTNRVGQIRSLAERQSGSPAGAGILICTAHRSKGLEFPGVSLGGDWRNIDTMEKRYRKSREESEKHVTLAMEEWNALYVAATRAILRLKGIAPILERSPDPNDPDVPPDYVPPDHMPSEHAAPRHPRAEAGARPRRIDEAADIVFDRGRIGP